MASCRCPSSGCAAPAAVLYAAPAVFAALAPLFECNVAPLVTAPPLQHAAFVERTRAALAAAVTPVPEPNDWRQAAGGRERGGAGAAHG